MDSTSNQTTVEEQGLKKALDEVLRKIGRNVLLFQQMEQALKMLVSVSNISGYAGEIKSKQASKIESVKTQTMGRLVGQYIENNSPEQTDDNEPENLEEAYISFKFAIETNEETHKQQKELMAALVDERNILVHHFLSSFNSTSINSCIDAQNRLDKQADRVRIEIDNFRSILTAFEEMKKSNAELIASKEFENYLKTSFTQQSSLANILTNLAQNKARNDGWLELSKAASIINIESPDELKNLKKNHDCKKLRDMMIKTELFEFIEEKTAKGSRVLYRLNQG